jgi:CHASE3 domain sensor protein
MKQGEQMDITSSQRAAKNKRMVIILATLVICIYLGFIIFNYIT